jgi:AcrR family transcriptional regulator
MPRPKKTPAEIEAARAQILDTAYAILQTDGPEAITARAIAERMGVAHMSLFTYFDNQAAILDALRTLELERWRAAQQRIADRAQSEAIPAVVRELLGMYIAFACENPNLYRLAWVMPEALGESPEANRQRRRMTVEHLAGLLQQGMDRGDFARRDPFLAAGVVLGIVNMPYILYFSGKVMEAELRDRMVPETIFAAENYLKQA